jgi:S1-C subfamily serine protease
MSTSDNPLVAFSEAMANAVAKAGAATVLVNARRRMPASGVQFAPGLVLTASHAVEREDNLSILSPDGAEISATLSGRDPSSDLAVLRLEKTSGALAERAAEAGRVGQLVLALGRPTPNGIEASLGVISAVGGPVRMQRGGLLERYLRTDTIPYPGFSGGPLIDAAGQVLGINTSGLTHGAAITIPASLAWTVADALGQHGRVRRGYLGVRSQPVQLPAAAQQALGREQQIGLLLVGVDDGSPAANGGLMLGDVLVALAGQLVEDPDALVSMLAGSLVGTPVAIEVIRGGQPQTLSVTVGERP